MNVRLKYIAVLVIAALLGVAAYQAYWLEQLHFTIGEQMCVYAQSSRPAALGSALAHDANQPGADMNEIQARINELRNIYSPGEFKTFEAAYQAALKPEN